MSLGAERFYARLRRADYGMIALEGKTVRERVWRGTPLGKVVHVLYTLQLCLVGTVLTVTKQQRRTCGDKATGSQEAWLPLKK